MKYQIDSYTADQSGTLATSNGSVPLAVSGVSMTANWRISNADWNGLSQGTHTIYVKAVDTSGNCRGCDGVKSLVIKKDSVVPDIAIERIRRTSPDPKVITNNWLKAGIYEISVSVADNIGGSGVDTTYGLVTIRSRGADDAFGPNPITGIDDDKIYNTIRTTANKFNVLVGPDNDPSHSFNNSLNDCVTEKEGRCRIYVYVRDLAGNETVPKSHDLNIDYTAPTAQ